MAKKRLPRFVFDYFAGGSGDESVLSLNKSDFHKITLKQEILKKVANIDTSINLLGQKISFPVLLAPVAMAGAAAKRGEVQAAIAAEKAGVPFCLSTLSIASMEEVQSHLKKPIWFQLYVFKNRKIVTDLLKRAAAIGCENLLVTVDVPVLGFRHRDVQNGSLNGGAIGRLYKYWQIFSHPKWLINVGVRGRPLDFGNLKNYLGGIDDATAIKTFIDEQVDPNITWDDIRLIRKQWSGNLIVKGIMSAEDAKMALKIGADAVVVSNHGGRQASGCSSSISKLPEIAGALSGQLPILLDSGVRNGVDVIRALALGANAVLIGRPWVYALAIHGGFSVSDLLASYHREIIINMSLAGITQCEGINQSVIDRIN